MILNLITVFALDDDDDDGDGCLTKAKCYRSQKKNEPSHDIEV